MSRNPYATALRHVRQQRIEDKRPNAETVAAMREADELIAAMDVTPSSGCVFYDLATDCPKLGCLVCSEAVAQRARKLFGPAKYLTPAEIAEAMAEARETNAAA